MDIKYIHVTLIVVSIALSLGFGLWTFTHGYALWGGGSLVAALALIIYCVRFIKKIKVL